MCAFTDVCRCVCALIHCGAVEIGPTRNAVNGTNRGFCVLPVSLLISSHSNFFFHLFCFDSPSHLFSFHFSSLYPLPVSVYCSSSSLHSFPSRLLARWLVYHWDGCRIKDATLFFPSLLHRSFSASLSLSLPSLILVSSLCGAFNASEHMVVASSWRCRGAFIGASKHSCNNARQGSEFFIKLMLYQGDPSNSSSSSPSKTHSTTFFLLKLNHEQGLFTGRMQS